MLELEPKAPDGLPRPGADPGVLWMREEMKELKVKPDAFLIGKR
jgi:hypothetical protein